MFLAKMRHFSATLVKWREVGGMGEGQFPLINETPFSVSFNLTNVNELNDIIYIEVQCELNEVIV
jgi:hypothetical protein